MNDAVEKDVERLPFDQYQRYRLVVDILDRLRGDGGPLTVLDVGGRTALLRDFLPTDRVTLVDVEASDVRERLVLGDGCRLPFGDASFDVVCAFDTLEHVPPGAREAFVSECRRTARRWVVLAGPYDAPRVNAAEARLKRFLGDKLGMRHRYLEEHSAHGLPKRGAVESQLVSLGGRVESLGHANLERWLALMCLSMYLDDDPALRAMAPDVFAFYNARLYASDHAEPVYRHAVVAAFGDAELPSFDALLAPPVAPKGTLDAFQELAEALLAFDRERVAWRVEREAFEASVDALESELLAERAERSSLGKELAREREASARTASELEARIAEYAEQERVLGADLVGHKATLAEVQADLEMERGARAKEAQEHAVRVAEYEETVGGLEEDLAGHKETLAALRAELDVERAARADEVRHYETRIGEHVEQERVLADDLEGHRASLAELAGELELQQLARAQEAAEFAARAEEYAEQARVLEADLAGHRASLAELEGEVRAERAVRAKEAQEYAARVAEFEEQARALESDLAGHEDSLAERGRAIAGLEARMAEERGAFESALADLERQLAEHRGVLAHREGLLAEHRDVLAQRDALLAALRAKLYGRAALRLVQGRKKA